MGRRTGVVVLLSIVAGCSLHSSGKEAATVAPPAPISLAGRACEARLQAADKEAGAQLDLISQKEDEIKDARTLVREARRRLREAKRELKTQQAQVKHAEARAGATRDAYESFVAAHGTVLPPDLYQYGLNLREAAVEAQDTYRKAYASYRPVFRAYRTQARDYNAKVKAANKLAHEGRSLAREQTKREKAYEHERDGCLEQAGLLAAGQETTRIESLEKELASAVAGTIAEPPVAATCHDPQEWRSLVEQRPGIEVLGGVDPQKPQVINLSPQVCYAFHRLRYLDHRPDLSCVAASRGSRVPLCGPRARETITAVEVLAHEAFHTTGIDDEAKTECYGLQEMAAVAVALGFTREDGNSMAYYAWHFPEVPEDYRSDECRNGGALDRHSESNAFPS